MAVSRFVQNSKMIFDVVSALCERAGFDYFIVIAEKNGNKKSKATGSGCSEANKQQLFDYAKEYMNKREENKA